MTDSYADLKAANADTGRCVRPGCKRRCSGDTLLCHGHRQAAKAARRRSDDRNRKARRAKGLCAFCGRKSKTYRCPQCKAARAMARQRKIRSADRGADKRKLLAERTTVDKDGRTRFHGRLSRGAQPRAQLDDKDIDDAIAALQKAKVGLAAVRAPGNADMPRIQLREAVHAVLAVGSNGIRLYGDVLRRNGCDPEVLLGGRDEDEDASQMPATAGNGRG